MVTRSERNNSANQQYISIKGHIEQQPKYAWVKLKKNIRCGYGQEALILGLVEYGWRMFKPQ